MCRITVEEVVESLIAYSQFAHDPISRKCVKTGVVEDSNTYVPKPLGFSSLTLL